MRSVRIYGRQQQQREALLQSLRSLLPRIEQGASIIHENIERCARSNQAVRQLMDVRHHAHIADFHLDVRIAGFLAHGAHDWVGFLLIPCYQGHACTHRRERLGSGKTDSRGRASDHGATADEVGREWFPVPARGTVAQSGKAPYPRQDQSVRQRQAR